MAKSQSAPLVSGGQYLSIGKAAKFLGVSVQALRLWEKEGRLVAYRTPGGAGHRRYSVSDLKKMLGVENDSARKKIALYVRVSHASQSAHLGRQRERLIAEVCEREDSTQDQLAIYEEIASSFGNRPKLNQLVDAVIDNRVSRIYAEHHDRLSRVASLTRLIEHLARKHDVEIIALDREADEDSMKANLAELVEFVHVISCRTIARRTAERRKKKLPPETISFLQEQINQGRGIKDAVKLANMRGHRTVDGVRISYRVGHNYFRALKMAQTGGEDHSFEKFLGECVERSKGSKAQAHAIHLAYRDWCQKKGLEPLSKWKCGEWLRRKNMKYETKCGYIWYIGFSLIGYPDVIHGKGKNATQLQKVTKKLIIKTIRDGYTTKPKLVARIKELKPKANYSKLDEQIDSVATESKSGRLHLKY